MFIDEIKLFAKNEKELETPLLAVRIYMDRIMLRCMRHSNNEK